MYRVKTGGGLKARLALASWPQAVHLLASCSWPACDVHSPKLLGTGAQSVSGAKLNWPHSGMGFTWGPMLPAQAEQKEKEGGMVTQGY